MMTTPVLAVLTLLVGALAVAFWPQNDTALDAEPAAQNPAREMQVLPSAERVSSPTGVAPPELSPAQGSTLASAPVATKATPMIGTGVVAVGGASALPLANTASAPLRPASAVAAVVKVSAGAPVPGESGVLMFKAKDQSWVEVVDAKGTAVLRRILQAGEVTHVNGVLPLRVIVGRIDATEVTVRGRKLDMTTISKDNVGRFEVGQ
jgi:cytoskeleton protein RodZ